jgi:type IV secretory pathway VirB4 component
LADLLAPSCLEIGQDSLCLDGRYARTFALIQYPRTVVLGWLNRLVSSGEHLDLSLHLVPLDTALAQTALTARMTQLRSSQLHADKQGHIDDAATGTALGDCRRVRQALQEGHEKLLSVSLYVTVYGSSPADLEARAVRVQQLFAALMAQTRPAVWQAQDGLHSTLPAGHDGLRVRRNLPSSSVVTLFPFTAPRLEMDGGVLWGRNIDTNGLVLVTPWTQPNANVAVMATSGAGKSYAIKLDLLRTLPLGIHALVIDPDGEYAGLAAALQGQVVRLGPGSGHRLNPLALPRPPRGVTPLPTDNAARDQDDDGEDDTVHGSVRSLSDALAAHMASLLPLLEVLLAGDAVHLTPLEKAVVEQSLAACYGAAGITADPATHLRRPPTFADLVATLAAHGDATGLADRLKRYCTGPYAGIFNGQSTVDLDNRLVAFSLAGLPEETTEPEVRTAVMLLIAAHVLRTAQLDRRQQRRIVVDEAHVLARHRAGDRFLANMARRARKYGLGVTAISQQLDDFLATTSGQAVLKNSSTRLLLLQTAETLAALEQHLQLTQVERARLLACGRGEGLLLMGRKRVFVRLEASPDEHRLCHTDAVAHETTIRSVVRHHPLAPAASPASTPAQPAPGDISPAAVSMARQEQGGDQIGGAQGHCPADGR